MEINFSFYDWFFLGFFTHIHLTKLPLRKKQKQRKTEDLQVGLRLRQFNGIIPVITGYSPTNLRISLNLRTTPQVGIAAWYPKNGKKISALRAGSDNTAGWNSSTKPQVGGGGVPCKYFSKQKQKKLGYIGTDFACE